jgi:hypothetical protein
MAAVGQRGGEQFVVAVEQIGDGALGDRHPALAQGGMDLGHGAVVAVAQRAHERDDVETELVLGESQSSLGLGSVGLMVARTVRDLAAPHLQAHTHRAGQRYQGAAVLVADAHRAPARRAQAAQRA